MEQKTGKNKGGGSNFWGAMAIAFSRMPFFEIAFVAIIVVVIWRLPDIISSVGDLIQTKETFWLGVGICIGLATLVGFCCWGLKSRKGFYKLFFPKVSKNVIVQNEKKAAETNKVARKEIKKASRG